MKRIKFVLGLLLLGVLSAGCSYTKSKERERQNAQTSEMGVEERLADEILDLENQYKESIESNQEDREMGNIEVIIGDTIYQVKLYNNKTAKEFLARLPLTLDMSELNGNEKYNYLSEVLTADSAVPEGIHAGDLMLFGTDCLVLFYDSFSTSYSYTPIGYIENPEGLGEVLGGGNVQVIFRAGID